jgi:membrane-bound lytic murein transglycosylase MltF
MQPTWEDMQLKLGFVGSRTNPRHNIRAAAFYMSKLLYVWRGRGRDKSEKLPLARSSYNCGTGCVLKAQRRANDARDWEDLAPHLPAEAREYVLHIRRHYQTMETTKCGD